MSETVYLIIGIALIILGGIAFVALINGNRTCSKKVIGKVIRVEMDSKLHYRGSRAFIPVVSYTVDGKEYSAKSNTYTYLKTRYVTDQEVEVRYNPKKPEEMQLGVDALGYIAGVALFLIGLGIVITWFI